MPVDINSALTGINKYLQNFADGLSDLASLDVITLTGTITLQPVPAAAGATAVFDPTSFFTTLSGQIGQQNSGIRVVAFTHQAADLDGTMFVGQALDDEAQKLVAAHREMVKQAQDARLETVKFLAGLLKLPIP